MTHPALTLVAHTGERVTHPTGEIPPDAPSYGQALALLAEQEDIITGLERDIRGWASRYAQLQRDKEASAREHESWADIQDLHDYWRRKCNHPRSRFGADEFWQAEPLWREYGEDFCRRAIDGAAFDPATRPRRNGSTERFDSWELIFRNRSKFESFVNRAPKVAA